jgi:ribonuclease BN (tRNA processing enzyme)
MAAGKNRRQVLAAAGGLGAAAALGEPLAAAPARPPAVAPAHAPPAPAPAPPPPVQALPKIPPDTRIVLLGTKGGPRVTRGRANFCNLLWVDKKPYVIDCGYGVTRQLMEAGVEPQEVRTIFVTHNYSDHILELGPLIYNAWMGGLNEQINVYGPPPLRRILNAYFQHMAFDIALRVEDEGRPDLTQLVKVQEFDKATMVMQIDGLKVSATKVRHPPLMSAFAYRFDTPSRSIVLSGATAFSSDLIAFAKGADVLVHEVMSLAGMDRLIERSPNAPRLRKHLIDSHTTTEQVGRVAQEAGVKMLVLSHFVPGDDPAITDDMWAVDARKMFNGQVVVGRDLLMV